MNSRSFLYITLIYTAGGSPSTAATKPSASMDLLAEAASQAELQQIAVNLDKGVQGSQGEIGAVHL